MRESEGDLGDYDSRDYWRELALQKERSRAALAERVVQLRIELREELQRAADRLIEHKQKNRELNEINQALQKRRPRERAVLNAVADLETSTLRWYRNSGPFRIVCAYALALRGEE